MNYFSILLLLRNAFLIEYVSKWLLFAGSSTIDHLLIAVFVMNGVSVCRYFFKFGIVVCLTCHAVQPFLLIWMSIKFLWRNTLLFTQSSAEDNVPQQISALLRSGKYQQICTSTLSVTALIAFRRGEKTEEIGTGPNPLTYTKLMSHLLVLSMSMFTSDLRKQPPFRTDFY